jgi:uncharacterized membrane protein YvbJ
MEPTIKKQCAKCKIEVSEIAYFCSNCGQSLKSRPEETSIQKQILVYFISFFLAPFGLGYAFKYLSQSDKKSKTIGAISLILTILAIMAVIYIGKAFLEKEYSTINLISNGGF